MKIIDQALYMCSLDCPKTHYFISLLLMHCYTALRGSSPCRTEHLEIESTKQIFLRRIRTRGTAKFEGDLSHSTGKIRGALTRLPVSFVLIIDRGKVASASLHITEILWFRVFLDSLVAIFISVFLSEVSELWAVKTI